MKCKKCKTEVPVRHGIYCESCMEKFRAGYAAASEERQQNKIQCRICGKYFVLLAAHTFPVHGLTGRKYRKMFGYDVKKGLIPEHYRQARQALNKKHQPYKHLKGKGAPPFKKGSTKKYIRSEETIGRLTKQFEGIKVTEATKKKLSEAQKGKHHSKKSIAKMSKARKKYWKLKKAKE